MDDGRLGVDDARVGRPQFRQIVQVQGDVGHAAARLDVSIGEPQGETDWVLENEVK